MGYVFEPDELGKCVELGLGKPREEAMDLITRGLSDRYGPHVSTKPRKWILNNAGGAMGQLCFLHASLSEYLIFFGSPIGTEGHSGRYSTEVYDWTFDGEMWCYLEGETERTVYGPGSLAHLGSDQVKGYRIPDHAWMLEYSRGAIPSMLPFGLADTLMSTLDFKTFGKTMDGFARNVVGSLLRGKI
jgi:C-8 sterol isomerase